MTAESLKPFLNLPNASATGLKTHKSTAKCCLIVLGCILVVALFGALIGVQIWHLNRTTALEREVDDLKLQLQLQSRAYEFNDYEFDNELFQNPDEYDTGYEPSLDPDLFGERETSETLDDGITDSGKQQDEDDDDDSGRDTGRDYSRIDEDIHRLEMGEDSDVNDDEEYEDGDSDDDTSLYESEDISVTATGATGKRRARSISGVTRQGVPIVDEPYVPRRNRTHRRLRIFEQLRQQPEEVVTPPTTPEMFSWDRSTQTFHRRSNSQQQTYGSISIRPFPQESHHFRGHHPTSTPFPEYSSPSGSMYYQRNELTPDNPTKAPAQIMNRMSRVQSTNGETRRVRPQSYTRFPKVISNPGTQQELVRAAESRVGSRKRKSSGQHHKADPIEMGVHFFKKNSQGVHTKHRHTNWTTAHDMQQNVIKSKAFTFTGDGLIIKETGLYYVYAQVTYNDKSYKNGFRVLVHNKRHLSCTVQAAPSNDTHTNTCFTAGLVNINQNDTPIVVEDIDADRTHVMHEESTFFGAFKVGCMPNSKASQ